MKHEIRGSLWHQINQRCNAIQMKKGHLTQVMDHTKKQYKTHTKAFGQWCKQIYGCRNFEDCATHIQDYADHLVQKGLSASTIHTYLAAVCRTWDMPMDEIKKPLRYTAQNTRSRGTKMVDRRSDAKRGASPRLYDFAARVGIRRKEYGKLKGDDLVRDESGHLCVRVKRGKGGKFQLQRILPGDEGFIRTYFNGDPQCRVFSPDEMRNKIDLHHLRAQVAQRAYYYYINRMETEPSYRATLAAEIKARWKKYCGKAWMPSEVEGNYHIRGKNRELAKQHGLPIFYDRLALMAVSVFHLSHWRLDVTVNNYMLAF